MWKIYKATEYIQGKLISQHKTEAAARKKAKKVIEYSYTVKEDSKEETVIWCREMLEKSPLALRMIKGALNADCDGQAGLQQFAGDATMLFYMTEEAQEGRDAFKEKRKPKFEKFPRLP